MNRILLIILLCVTSWALGAREVTSLNSGNGIVSWTLVPQEDVADIPAMLESGFDAGNWVPAVVPGAAFTSYVEAGLEPDPNFGDNAYKVDKKKYDRNFWYRTVLKTSDLPAGKHIWLCFEGVNRKAEVYFNGLRLGELDGFMDRGKFDIAPYLSSDSGENVLAVLVYSPTHPIPNHASPTYISSAGWDWMPYVPGLLGGITDDVYVCASGDVTIADPWVRTKVPTRDKGIVSVTADLINNSDKEVEAVVRGTINPGGIVMEKKVKLPAGRRISCGFNEREFSQLKITNPELWWPNGYGEQNLYDCSLVCEIDGKVSDSQDVTFGIREYSYSFPNGVFQLSVNGERIFCKGGNWGMSEWMLRCRGESTT